MNNEAGTSEVFPDWGGLSVSVTSVCHDDSSPSPGPRSYWLTLWLCVSLSRSGEASQWQFPLFLRFMKPPAWSSELRPGWQGWISTPVLKTKVTPSPVSMRLKPREAFKHLVTWSHHIKCLICASVHLCPVSLVCLHLITFDSSNGPCSTLGLIRPSLPLPPLMSLCVPLLAPGHVSHSEINDNLTSSHVCLQ